MFLHGWRMGQMTDFSPHATRKTCLMKIEEYNEVMWGLHATSVSSPAKVHMTFEEIYTRKYAAVSPYIDT